MCVRAPFRKERKLFTRQYKGLHFPRLNQVFLAEAVTLFPSWRARLFLSLKQPHSPERWGQSSNRQGSSQHSLRAIPAPPQNTHTACPPERGRLPAYPPKRGRLPACFWRGKNVWRSQGCWQRPHRLAPRSEPSGGVREVRTVPGERRPSSVAPQACRITRHGAGGAGQGLQGRGDVGALPLKLSTSPNSRGFFFSLAFCACFF